MRADDFAGTTTTGADSFSQSENLDGNRVGVGAEYRLGVKTDIKLEYRYSN